MTVPAVTTAVSPGKGTSLPDVAGSQLASTVQSPVAPFHVRVAMPFASP